LWEEQWGYPPISWQDHQLLQTSRINHLRCMYRRAVWNIIFVGTPDRSVPWARQIRFRLSHPTYSWLILILSCHVCLCIPSGFVLPGLPTDMPYTYFFSSMHAICPAHLYLWDFIAQIIFSEKYKLRSSSRIVLHPLGAYIIVVKALCYEPEGHGFETRWGKCNF
jgi:hypothetical protein